SVLAAFDRERALAWRGQAVLGFEHRANPRREAQPLQARGGENDGLAFASIELREARVEVAAKRLHLQRRMALAELGLTPQAGRADDASRRQPLESRAQVRNQTVA